MADPRVEQIFAATHGLPREQRRAEVVRLCAGDAALEAECRRLLKLAETESVRVLRADAAPGPAVDARGGEIQTGGSGEGQAGIPTIPAAPGPPRPLPSVPGAPKALESIGPYRILSVLGEGGFGVVYAAERREPIRQRVALKLIKPGMDSRAVIARFEQERQALAVMNHPNIAKVLDAGVTDEALGSRPYFVMEHVPGEPITEYCDRHNLTLKQRLELFIPVCEAVQHAHHKGIIHRDLKPSNILVAVVDGKPIPKVIDFGVAKATAKTFTDATIFTEQGQLIGTPEYMSPEQAEMGATDIDTRSDVYSLGAVLYELLAGAVPFDSKSLRAAALFEIQRIIREVEPPKPSTRLTSLGGDEAAAIAKRRQMDREALATELRRELDWIPLKALRKDRTERYATPKDMADDIHRFLNGAAIDARPPSLPYRLQKQFAGSRYPIATGVTALAAVFAVFAKQQLDRGQEARRQTMYAPLLIGSAEALGAWGSQVQSVFAHAPPMDLAQAQAHPGLSIAAASSAGAEHAYDTDPNCLLMILFRDLNAHSRLEQSHWTTASPAEIEEYLASWSPNEWRRRCSFVAQNMSRLFNDDLIVFAEGKGSAYAIGAFFSQLDVTYTAEDRAHLQSVPWPSGDVAGARDENGGWIRRALERRNHFAALVTPRIDALKSTETWWGLGAPTLLFAALAGLLIAKARGTRKVLATLVGASFLLTSACVWLQLSIAMLDAERWRTSMQWPWVVAASALVVYLAACHLLCRWRVLAVLWCLIAASLPFAVILARIEPRWIGINGW